LKVNSELNCRNADTSSNALFRCTAGVPAGSFSRHNRELEISKAHPSLRDDAANEFEVLLAPAVAVLRTPVGEGRCQPSRGESLLEVFGSSGHDFSRAESGVESTRLQPLRVSTRDLNF
jgi:hypothetical protein